jgi:hypothetical protein
VENICFDLQTCNKERLFEFFVEHRGIFSIDANPLPPLPSLLSHEQLQPLTHFLVEGTFLRDDRTRRRPLDFATPNQKQTIALNLARCLLDFFDSMAGFPVWDSTKVFLALRPGGLSQEGRMYVTFEDGAQDVPTTYTDIGNPILLSFAKLLLEIEGGREIKISETETNIDTWAKLCVHAREAELAGSGLFAQAVRGCLYLHLHISRDGDPKANFRKCLYEQVVSHLEAAVNQPTRKRRRQHSPDRSDSVDMGPNKSRSRATTPNPRPVSRKKLRTTAPARPGEQPLAIRDAMGRQDATVRRCALYPQRR